MFNELMTSASPSPNYFLWVTRRYVALRYGPRK